jgi:2'-hydroxyisoflavone reductase
MVDMRLLVLGGTVFLSNAVAAEAVRRGHQVTCAARGNSGAIPAGARLVKIDRDRPGGLAPLAGARFDAVIDVARMSYGWVRPALDTIDAGHWTFVSSLSVYDGDGLHEPFTEESADMEKYGPYQGGQRERRPGGAR